MEIRLSCLDRPKARAITPRRLAAAERALAHERQRLALFAREVLAEQETAEERLCRFDAQAVRQDQAFRDLAAKHWREGRRLLRSLPDCRQSEVLAAWNRSSIPPDAAYFVDFVRTRLQKFAKPNKTT
jgi:Holliday junction resolvase-like predicted endonuclease